VQTRSAINIWKAGELSAEEMVPKPKSKFPHAFAPVEDYLLHQALKIYMGLEEPPGTDTSVPSTAGDELAIRIPEYTQLQVEHQTREGRSDLVVRLADMAKLSFGLRERIHCISLVERLMETRVMAGFTRLIPNAPEGAPGQSLLWKQMPAEKERWLPATQVFGEGIFICFKEEPLVEWENRPEVLNRIAPLQQRYQKAAGRSRWEREQVTPRLVMLHTLAHLLIRRMVFECGYGSASLRERLYISSQKEHPIAGILIYTASGDSEGSMGGLVRMGELENLDRIFAAALEEAGWCSADPICRESGIQRGQGIDGLNIAACHSCALLPETSCELFNRFLDRSLVVQADQECGSAFFS
jgi:MrfA Zn-binding domain